MIITKEKILSLWKMRKILFDNNAKIVKRFKHMRELFIELETTEIEYKDDIVKINNKELKFEDGRHPSLCYFACAADDMTADTAFKGVQEMKKAMPEYELLIDKVGRMLGGFDFESENMVDEYRLVSNTIKGSYDDGTLTSSGIVRHPSSHFADNNYFFNVADTVNKIRKESFKTEETRLALRYPDSNYENETEAEESQKKALKTRFPYKYFYMWTHRKDCIHLLSLAAFRELVNQADSEIKYNQGINQSYDDFIKDNCWKDYSKKLCSMIPDEDKGDFDSFMGEFSLFLSIIMLEDQDAKNIKDLLDTGNKAIVLWGPPGTGKTYTAKELVCEELEIKKGELEKHNFVHRSAQDLGQNNTGYWTIVQFHPSYTYEDFIGGIMPKLDGESLTYTLKEGIFKQLCDEAAKQSNAKKKYIIVIDEINRADLSSIFGELMYALEYRDEEVVLPNFLQPFKIPSNVYIIGTMNNIDKSLATFDLALRRRFGFYKIMPNLKVLERILHNVEEESLQKFIKKCEKLNAFIADTNNGFALGSDFQIGHAYYAKIADFLGKRNSEDVVKITSFDMEKLWMYHLEPLLEEYLGNKMEDTEVVNEMTKQKEKFIKVD